MATESDSTNNGALATIVAVGALVTLVVALAVTALVRTAEQEASDSKNATVNPRPMRELKAEQLAQLSQAPAWVDKAKGTVSIPIERAMDLVVSDYTRDPTLATPPLPTAAVADAGADAAEGEAAALDEPDAGLPDQPDAGPVPQSGSTPPKPAPAAPGAQ